MSVIVATRNSAAHIGCLLESVSGQTYPNIEVIVVDNDSSDATVAIARRYTTAVLSAGPERSAQRNYGVAHARGQYVLILDADMVLERNVVSACTRAALAGATAVVITEVSIGEGFWAACKILERSCYENDETVEAARFFRRDVFIRYGGYDESLSGPEDWDLPARMRNRGEPIGRAQGARISHDEGHLRLSTLLRKKFYYGRSLPSYVQKHPGLAVHQIPLIRSAFVRHRRRLASDPVHTAGMLCMKGAELGAGLLGMAAAAMSRRSATSGTSRSRRGSPARSTQAAHTTRRRQPH